MSAPKAEKERKDDGQRKKDKDERATKETLAGFTARMRQLLELEFEAEREESSMMLEKTDETVAARRGVVLLHMRIQDIEGGLLGKTLVTLQRNKGGTTVLPAHSLSQHDIVRVRPMKAKQEAAGVGVEGVEGVVYRLLEDSITIAVDSMGEGAGEGTEEEGPAVDELVGQSVKVEKVANYVTQKRLSWTLDQLDKQGQAAASETCGAYRVLFMGQEARFVPMVEEGAVKFFNRNLDESQRVAVVKALASQDVVLVHGPPGTGKTTTLVEYIRQEVARGSRVLACAGSNVAVDNIVEGLVKAGKKSMSSKVCVADSLLLVLTLISSSFHLLPVIYMNPSKYRWCALGTLHGCFPRCWRSPWSTRCCTAINLSWPGSVATRSSS